MRLVQKLSTIFLVLVSFSLLKSQDVDYSGTSAINMLKIGVGARIAAMGDAGSATVNDATALFWNPAAACRVGGTGSISVSSMGWLVDTRLSYLAAVLNLGGFGHIGLDVQYMDFGDIEETTVYDQDGTGRFVSANDLSVGLAYARQLTERFSFGVKVKYIGEKLASVSASAFGMDIGADFQTSFFDNQFRIAASLSNFGTKVQFSGHDLAVIYTIPGSPSGKQIPADLTTHEWEIPLLFRFGVSNYFINNENFSAFASYEVFDSRDFKVRHNIGAELGYQHMFYLRGGYKFNYDLASYTAGIGFDFTRLIGYGLVIDYAYLDFDVFEALHQFSLSVNF